MIRDTSLEITDQYKRWQVEMDARYARRNRLRHIDELLNELELLNLAEAQAMPKDLLRQVGQCLADHEHALASRKQSSLTIPEVMEALYEIQDTLLLGSEEEEEAG
ncbi:MAG TPA: hypothetical protein VG245_00980 [Candidatus Dormibacteraeota bacterium]|jgi:hypothetical protein|nr:hypothetical protein [Candidatus Dormibacteraeota bacterium]